MLPTATQEKRKSAVGFIIIVLLLISGTASAQNCPPAMEHYWKLDETENPTAFLDYFLDTDNAICTDCPTPSKGILNGGQQFDGSDDAVNVADDDSIDWGAGDSFSIEFWINTTQGIAGNKVFVGRDDPSTNLHWWVGVAPSGKVRFKLLDTTGNGITVNNDADGGDILNDGVWHHIVAVKDGTEDMNSIYIDGALVDSLSFDYMAGFGSSVDVNIGHLNKDFHYNGTIDEIAFYDLALELADIQSHYNDRDGLDYCSVKTTTVPSSTTTTAASCPAEGLYGKSSEKTEFLRYFRDNILSQSPEGREIIKLYYQWSPLIVKAMEEDEAFRGEVKELVDGVLLIEGGIE
jgi:hypothetical protein